MTRTARIGRPLGLFALAWLVSCCACHAAGSFGKEIRPLAESLKETLPVVSVQSGSRGNLLIIVIPGGRTMRSGGGFKSGIGPSDEEWNPWEVWGVPVDSEGPRIGRASLLAELATRNNPASPPIVCIDEGRGMVYCVWAVGRGYNAFDFKALSLAPGAEPPLAWRKPATAPDESRLLVWHPPGRMELLEPDNPHFTPVAPVALSADGEGGVSLVLKDDRGRLLIFTSPDRGETWSPARLLSEAEAKAVSVPRASPLPAPPVVVPAPPPTPRWPLALGAGIAAGLGGLVVGFLLAALCFRKRRAA